MSAIGGFSVGTDFEADARHLLAWQFNYVQGPDANGYERFGAVVVNSTDPFHITDECPYLRCGPYSSDRWATRDISGNKWVCFYRYGTSTYGYIYRTYWVPNFDPNI